jgi:hypothetical protein
MGTILHQTKSAFEFNSLYVIESLDVNEGDKLTGTCLLENLRPYAEQCEALSTALITVEDAVQFRNVMEWLEDKAKEGQRPVLHFEIHGTDTMDGLYIKNGDVIEWPEVLSRISEINYASGCNVLATFAVCYGQYLAQYINVGRRMPFCISLGSFKELYEDDLELRFFAFYKELLTSFNIDKAYQSLLDAAPERPSNYSIIKADVLFANVMKSYLDTQCSRTALKLRAENEMDSNPLKFGNFTKEQRRQFIKNFRRSEREHHELYYKESVEEYFQLKEHPENRDRFLILESTDALLQSFDE